MKTTRVFATACLLVSSVALITAANISVGDEPGVVRLSSASPMNGGAGHSAMSAPGPNVVGFQGQPGVATMQPGPYPVPSNTAPYFERSYGATEMVQPQAFQPQPFGPILMFEQNIDDGLGYSNAYTRLNARLPYHIVPNTTVMLGDLSAAVTSDGSPVYNYGLVYRNYDQALNRVFGWNVFGDYDEGYGNGSFNRVTAGFESLGKYIDWRANAYVVTGNDSLLLSDTLTGSLGLAGNNAFLMHQQVRENAYSGGEIEAGGPLPILGRYGLNMYAGGYFLGNDSGYESVGFKARWQAMITESVTVNTYLTTDDTFGTNSWVSLQYNIPNYKAKRILKPDNVRERLQDPVIRDNRIHTNIDNVVAPEAVVNNKTGLPYYLMYVDPNATASGVGTYESPFRTLQQAEAANNPLVDILRVSPRSDDSGTNLTVSGGLHLFDCQTLLSSTKDFTLFSMGTQDFIIPGVPTTSNLGPLISNPTMAAGGSVVHLANQNRVIGMRIDGANTAGTVFGNGVSNSLPITDVELTMNTFTRYSTGANLQDVSGRVLVDMNNFDGLAGASVDGMNLSIASGSTARLLLQNNIASNNMGTGLSITAKTNSTLLADNPDGAGSGTVTAIRNNNASNNGAGIVVDAQANSRVSAVIEDNTAIANTLDGLRLTSNAATFDLGSLSGNLFNGNLNNGTFIHYLNGGTFNAVSEDLNGDGFLSAGEDLNGNGRLDRGIVSNTMNNNSIAGLCIFGEDASTGAFDIGGPSAALGNTFIGNTGAGVAVDLKDTATAQVDALFNTIQGGSGPANFTIVLDFIDPGQAPVTDIFGVQINPFDVTNYGFAASDFDLVTNAILDTVRGHFYNIPTVSQDARSPIPDGMQLDIDFVIGDNGVAPSNGATEYYVLNIGDAAASGGIANNIGNVRDANGNGPNPDLFGNPTLNGDDVAQVYANSLIGFGPFNPPNALGDIRPTPLDQAPAYAAHALTSGNLTFTRRAIGLVSSHELGHTLSLRHVDDTGAITPTGANPIMGTPAPPYLLPTQTLLEPAEFAYSANHLSEFPGDPQFIQNSVAQLASAIGLRTPGGQMSTGIAVNASDNARLLPSTFNNNTITGASNDGIAIVMNNNAVAEGVTIQGNQITNGQGNGVRLAANGPGAFIDADGTIGGNGVNVYSGTSFNQSNNFSSNAGDGFNALASNGGSIDGNLLNNTITNNGRNGVRLAIDNGGFMDFGTPASNRVIRDNTITGNGDAGIRLVSNVSATSVAQMDVVALGNTISSNLGGGIITNQNGPNNIPPAVPGVINNNILNLTVGGTGTTNANTLSGNGDAGIGVHVTGNGLANVDIRNATITGTTNGPDPILNGDGINLRRADSSLLLANIQDVSATGNAGDGLDVETQGNDKNDPNQPNTGTVNTVNWTRNNFSNNTQNGARFRTRGDSMLIADGTTNTLSLNGQNGVLIQTSETSNFGDATDGLPPGRRVVLDGNSITQNGVDGVQIVATEDSRALVQVTSTRIPAASGAHAALNSQGDTSISNNGRDGIRIDTTGGRSDILITSSTGQTTISGNGTVAGGNGIRWNASGDSEGSVNINRTNIIGNLRGATEDTNGDGLLALNEDANLNGILDNGEDLNGNGALDVGEDVNANMDLDVADGDGIQFNVSDTATAVLIVGEAGEDANLNGVLDPGEDANLNGILDIGAGNNIQQNGDDGIAVTVTGSNGTGIPNPQISIVGNRIGGELSGLAAGNVGDGISFNGFGDRSTGSGDIFAEFGPQGQLRVAHNLISQNGNRGANILLNGAGGIRDREFTPGGNFDPILISFNRNDIRSNGMEGIYYQASPGYVQNRAVFLGNTGFPGDNRQPQFTGVANVGGFGVGTGNNANGSQAFYNPLLPNFTNLNFGSVNGNTAYQSPYLNLATDQNSFLTVRDNFIQNNGTETITGEGLFVRVGTNAYVAADVQGNTFGGNLEQDFRTESFRYSANPDNFVDNTGIGTFDIVFLDDTAQFDLRFQNNTGNQILADSAGAAYTNGDIAKVFQPGVVNVLDRPVALFQVENGPNLNNPNNTFVNFGITQNILFEFDRAGTNYNVRAAADPLFPNIGFAPFLP